MNDIKSMEQRWGCTDPLRISDKMLDLLLLQVEEKGPIITLEGELLPPLLISELDYAAVVDICSNPTLLHPEAPVPLAHVEAIHINPLLGCWELPRYKDKKKRARYPIITCSSIDAKNEGAHRVFYRQLVEPIPAGLFIDHRCNNKNCCYPRHVEPTTHAVNNQRGHQDRKNRRAPTLWQQQPTPNNLNISK